jgi:hypothetical protein
MHNISVVKMNQSFDLSLNKLHRCIEELKKYLSSENPQILVDFQYSAVPLLTSFETVKNDAVTKLQTQRDILSEYYGLYDDLCVLETGLFNGNVSNGLSHVLTKTKYLSQKKALFERHKKTITIPNSYTTTLSCETTNLKSNLESLRNSFDQMKIAPQWNGSYVTPKLYLIPHSEQDYIELIKNVTKEITELEAKRDYINANCTASVVISKKGQEVLGL